MPNQAHIQDIVSSIKQNGIKGLIQATTKLYKNDVRSRLHYSDFYNRTDRATLPLISFDEAIYYSSTFTKEHFDRFYHALDNMAVELAFANKMTVVDYGCGQGLATLVLLDYLRQNNIIANKVLDIHLIEPSHVALALARQYVLAMAKYCQITVNISVHQQTLAQYLDNPITHNGNRLNLHLLSNIIDIQSIQSELIALSGYINNQPSKQIICAVSSYRCGFDDFRSNLHNFNVQDERFAVNSYRFNSNRCVWQNKPACGKALFAQKLA